MIMNYRDFKRMDKAAMQQLKGSGRDGGGLTKWYCNGNPSRTVCHAFDPWQDGCPNGPLPCVNTGIPCAVYQCP